MVKNTILYTSRNPKRVRKNVEITRKPGIITTRTGPSVYRLLSSSSLPQACCGLVVNYLYPVSQDSQHLVLTLIITVTHEKKKREKNPDSVPRSISCGNQNHKSPDFP